MVFAKRRTALSTEKCNSREQRCFPTIITPTFLYERLANWLGIYDLLATRNSHSLELQYSLKSPGRSNTSLICRVFAQNKWPRFMWISVRISDVGEIPLHVHSYQLMYIPAKQGAYRRWVGVQVWLSCVCKSFSWFSTNKLSVHS